MADGRQQVGSDKMLRGEDAVHGVKRKLAAGAQKVGEMGLAKAGLPREERHAERPPLNPSQ